MTEPRSDRLYVNCAACGHTWVAMHLPMAMDRVAKLMKHVACPRCANDANGILLATKEQALELERAGGTG